MNQRNPKKDQPEDVPLAAKFEQHLPAFLDMLDEFWSMRDGHFRHINNAKHGIDLLNDEVRPVYCASYWAGLTARQLVAAEISQTIAENDIETVTTE